jgi:hypothetical protein
LVIPKFAYHRALASIEKTNCNTMNKIYLLILIFTSHNISAQSRLHAFKITTSVRPDIEKVVNDYYGHFFNLKGEIIDETAHTIEYKSKLLPQGALESTITQIKNQKNIYSWQAIMLSTDEFEKAVEKYKEFYRQLNGSSMAVYGGRQYKLKGDFDTPDETRSFASSILEPDVKEKPLRRLKVEVALNYIFPEWTVKLLVYEKDADEDIRPTEKYDAMNFYRK